MKNYLFPALLLVILFASCTTTNKSVTSVPINPVGRLDPVKADYTIDMKSKLSGESKSIWLFGFLKLSGDPNYADGIVYSSNFGTGQEGFMRLFGSFAMRKVTQTKAAAAYNAVESSNGDFIVNPHYSVKQTKLLFGLIKSYSASVTGYKGKYTNIYQGKDEAKHIIIGDK
jgi:hypothetical protein